MIRAITVNIRVRPFACPRCGHIELMSDLASYRVPEKCANLECQRAFERLPPAGPAHKVEVLVFPNVAKDLMARDRREKEGAKK
jgi:hypothetical protein